MMLDVAGGVLIAAFVCGLLALGVMFEINGRRALGATFIVASIIAAIWIVLS